MKFKTNFLLLAFLSCSLLSLALVAAEMMTDVSGTWTGVVELENGQELPFVAVLDQEGMQISGILAGIGGAPDVTILDGKIEGNIVSFSGVRQIQDADVRFDYIAVNSADYLNFTIIRVGATGPNSVLSSMTRKQD